MLNGAGQGHARAKGRRPLETLRHTPEAQPCEVAGGELDKWKDILQTSRQGHMAMPPQAANCPALPSIA
eukprot:3513559-Pyramimonas_sp.AAC.1